MALAALLADIKSALAKKALGQHFFNRFGADCAATLKANPGPFAVGLYVASQMALAFASRLDGSPEIGEQERVATAEKLEAIVAFMSAPDDSAYFVNLLSGLVTETLGGTKH
jgi:hypothetical protein